VPESVQLCFMVGDVRLLQFSPSSSVIPSFCHSTVALYITLGMNMIVAAVQRRRQTCVCLDQNRI
jgi:hypothetical protein